MKKILIAIVSAACVAFAQSNALQLRDLQVPPHNLTWKAPATISANIVVTGLTPTVQGEVISGHAVNDVTTTSDGLHLFFDSSSLSQIQAYHSSAAATLILNAAGGNVGIGTTTPATILDINGVTTARGNILPSGTVNIGASGNSFNDGYFYDVFTQYVQIPTGTGFTPNPIQIGRDSGGALALSSVTGGAGELWSWTTAGVATTYGNLLPSAAHNWTLGASGTPFSQIFADEAVFTASIPIGGGSGALVSTDNTGTGYGIYDSSSVGSYFTVLGSSDIVAARNASGVAAITVLNSNSGGYGINDASVGGSEFVKLTVSGSILPSGTVNIGASGNNFNDEYLYDLFTQYIQIPTGTGLTPNPISLGRDSGGALALTSITGGAGELWSWTTAGVATTYGNLLPSAAHNWTLGASGTPFQAIFSDTETLTSSVSIGGGTGAVLTLNNTGTGYGIYDSSSVGSYFGTLNAGALGANSLAVARNASGVGAVTVVNTNGGGYGIVDSSAGGSEFAKMILTGITGSTQCLQANSSGVVTGSGAACGGISSLNSLTGALSIVGTSNRVSVAASGSTITLSGPQDLASTSTPIFGGGTFNGTLNTAAILPDTNNTYALGSSGDEWSNLYSANATIGALTVTSCSGCYSGGVTSLNSLTGALSIAGSTNEISVSPSGSTITLSTPQPISTSNAPTFAGLIISGSVAIGGGTGTTVNVTNSGTGYGIYDNTSAGSVFQQINATSLGSHTLAVVGSVGSGGSVVTVDNTNSGGYGINDASVGGSEFVKLTVSGSILPSGTVNIGASGTPFQAIFSDTETLTSSVSIGGGTGAVLTLNNTGTGYGIYDSSSVGSYFTVLGSSDIVAASNASGGAAITVLNSNSGGYGINDISVGGSLFLKLILTGITGSTQCLSVNSSGVVSGTGSACGSGSAGVSSINSLTGALSIAGTSNEISVSASGTTITLSTPQAIGTSSTPTFGGLTLNGGLSIQGGIIPTGASSYPLGSSSYPWGNVYTTNVFTGTAVLGSAEWYPNTSGAIQLGDSSKYWGLAYLTGFISSVNNSGFGSEVLQSGSGYALYVDQTAGSDYGLIDASSYGSYVTRLVVASMPTSCTGIPSKSLWNNSGVVNICP